jgi:hypothetical protein
MQDAIQQLATMRKQLEDMDKKVVDTFNNNTPSQYDGDPLFQPHSSPICKHWKPRYNDEEELFMNFNCGHPDADCDWSDTDHCSIMSCPDEDIGETLAGQLVNLYGQIHPVVMKLLDLFNTAKYSCDFCVNETRICSHTSNKESDCCAANCPL